MKNTNKNNKRKSVKFNLRKNTTRKFNKKESTLRKKNQKKSQRKSLKKQQKQKRQQQRQQKKQQRQQRQRKTLRKNMKGGAIPFSELGEVYGSVKHSFDQAVEVFKDSPATVPNNHSSPIDNPHVSKQFLRTEAPSQAFAAPDLKGIYDSAYGN